MKKIIAFSSTHGTGKTVASYDTCTMLKKLGKNVIVHDELARICPFPINQGAQHKSQSWLITKQISSELELIDKFDYIVTDRTVLDPYAYGKALRMPYIEDYLPAIKNHINNYCYKIYVPEPTAFDYQIDDGVRDLDKEFRQLVFEEIISGYNKCGIEYLLITSMVDVWNDLFTL